MRAASFRLWHCRIDHRYEGRRTVERLAHNRGDAGRDFPERLLRAGQRDKARTDPKRAPRGEAGGTCAAGAAGEYQGVAVGVFVILATLLEK